MRRLAPDLAHALAAEYVLGTLRGRARQRFAALAAADAGTAEILRRWERELTALVENVPPVAPPARVWSAIEARIAPPREARAPAEPGFWRSFGMAAGGLAAVLVAALLWLAPSASRDPLFVAVLTSPDAAPRMVVSLQDDTLHVRTVKPWGGIEGKSLELWVLPKEGGPRSLGLVANAGETTIRIAANDARMAGANALAISLEPPGGSPTKAPTGPVLCSGALAPVRKT